VTEQLTKLLIRLVCHLGVALGRAEISSNVFSVTIKMMELFSTRSFDSRIP